MPRSFPFAKSLRLPVIPGAATALAPFVSCSDAAEEEWVMYQDGKPVDSTTFGLQRTEPL